MLTEAVELDRENSHREIIRTYPFREMAEQAAACLEAMFAGQRTESEYLKGMYPLSVKRCQCLVEEACDRLDYSGSPMYDEYPDREFLYRVRDQIMKNAQDQGMEVRQDLTQVLLLEEIGRRRNTRG